MTVISVILYIFIVYGIATIIASEYLFSPIVDKFQKFPKLYYLLTCNKCLTIWIGLIISLVGFGVISPIFDPFIAYTSTCILNRVLDE
jgi:uncharacterized membrane-anchored protein